MSDAYEFWRTALVSDPKEWPMEPRPGAYKMRPAKGAPFIPVQIWAIGKDGKASREMTDTIMGAINFETVSYEVLCDRWTYCKPVSKADFEHYKANRMWPGDIGHNSGDLSLAEEIADDVATLTNWLAKTPIVDKATADMAANWRDRLNGLAKRADDERDAKVRPHLEAQRAINAEYKPLIDSAKGAASAARDKLTAYMVAEEKRRQEALAKAQKANEESGAELALPLEAAPVRAGGQRGRKAGLRTVTVFEVSDIKVLLAFLADNADLHEAAAEIGRRMAKAGVTVPGIVVSEKKVAA